MRHRVLTRVILPMILAIGLPADAQNSEIRHLPTPEFVKGIYVNLGTVHSPRFWKLVGMVERTELNTLVIDIRSNGGPILLKTDADTKALLEKLHRKNIYLIARIVVFKCGGSCWYEPSSRARWERVKEVSRRAILLGFDEINYDYVRYGSVNEPKSATPIAGRTAVIKAFFRFLKEEVRNQTGRPISVDIFGWAFLEPQKSIGQRVEDAVENFDFVMPMPYPSHWGRGNLGISYPGREPYKTVYRALSRGWKKVEGSPNRIAKLRTWIQAFDLESINPPRRYKYGPKEIRAQIQACYDAGCVGWVLWNAGNFYDEAVFEKQ